MNIHRTLITLTTLALSSVAGPVLAQTGTVRPGTPVLQPINLSQLLQVAPAFGSASLPSGLRLLQGDEATRFAALGTPTWITAAALQASNTQRTQRLNSNLQRVGRAVQGEAALRPELAGLLRLARTRPFEEPVLRVETRSGPMDVRLMSAEVGLEQAAGDLDAPRAQQGTNASLALGYARSLGLNDEGVRAVQAVNEAPRALVGDVTSAQVIRPVVSQALNTVARLDARPIALGTPVVPQGQGDGLDTRGDCTASPTGLYAAIDFPLKKFLPDVKSQGGRGTCWAFATVGAVETTLNRDFNRRVNLSEEDFVSYNKILAGQLDAGDGFWPLAAATQSQKDGYRFAYENAWQYNQSWKRSAKEAPKDSGHWTYTSTCTDYPYAASCSDTVHQAPSACLLVNGKQSCGFQLAQKRSPYGIDMNRSSNLYDPANRDASLFWTALALRAGNPVLMTHDANYLKGGGFVGDVPYSSVSHCDDNNKNCKPNTAADVQNWNHVVMLVGFVTNAELKARLPGAPQVDGGGYFIAKNSWGSCWGDGGYAYLPWNWMEKYVGRLDVNITGTVN